MNKYSSAARCAEFFWNQDTRCPAGAGQGGVPDFTGGAVPVGAFGVVRKPGFKSSGGIQNQLFLLVKNPRDVGDLAGDVGVLQFRPEGQALRRLDCRIVGHFFSIVFFDHFALLGSS